MKKIIPIMLYISSFVLACNAETLATNQKENRKEKKVLEEKKCVCTCTCHKKELRKKELQEAIDYYKNSPYHTFTLSR